MSVVDPKLCRAFAAELASSRPSIAAQLTAAVDLAERFDEVDALCAKMAAEHRLDLRRIVQLADVLRSAGIALPEGIPDPAPALTEERVREVVLRTLTGLRSSAATSAERDAIDTRAAKELAGAVIDLPPEVLRGLQLMRRHLDEGGHDWRKGTAMADVQRASEYLDRLLAAAPPTLDGIDQGEPLPAETLDLDPHGDGR